MSSILRCLVVEDHPDWQKLIQEALESIGGAVQVDISPTREAAESRIQAGTYDIATVDISLLDDLAGGPGEDELGLQLVERFFEDTRHHRTALLVVTGHSTSGRTRRLLRNRERRVFDVIEKADFEADMFLPVVRRALLDARFRWIEKVLSEQYLLQIRLGRESWMGSELEGPGNRSSHTTEFPSQYPFEDLSGRADRINFLLQVQDLGIWREATQDLGRQMYEVFRKDQGNADQLARAMALSAPQNPLLLQFSGPSTALGLPFELMRDEGGYLCHSHVLTRKLPQVGSMPSKKTLSFHHFLEGLAERNERLRVLVVGANSDGKIPMAEEEARILAKQIDVEASRLGLPPQIKTLIGAEATYDGLVDALETGGFHLFHYAGHGRFNDTLPEISGIVLGKGVARRDLTADNLQAVAARTPLQFVFLSCCLSARTAQQVGRGDFHGILEALARADIPSVLGYRWTVSDPGALAFTQAFYSSLWETLSPSRALLETRRRLKRELGSDDPTWVSPILLCQTD